MTEVNPAFNQSDDPQDLLLVLANIKAAQDALKVQHEQMQARLIEALDKQGKDKIAATSSDGRTVKGSVVRAEKVVIDQAALEAALPAKVWEKVTKRVLDNDLLEAHVATKAIKEEVVAACSEVRQNKPYVRVSGDAAVASPVLDAVSVVSQNGKPKAAMKRVKAKRAAGDTVIVARQA